MFFLTGADSWLTVGARVAHFNVTEHPTRLGPLSKSGERFPKIVYRGT